MSELKQHPKPKKGLLTNVMLAIALSFSIATVNTAINLWNYGYEKTLSWQLTNLESISTYVDNNKLYNTLGVNNDLDGLVSKVTTLNKEIKKSLTSNPNSFVTREFIANKTLINTKNNVGRFLEVLMTSFLIISTKLLVLALSIPLLFILATLGLIDGLNQRAIRTAELGRETSYLFHRMSAVAIKATGLILLLWLIIPIEIRPEVALLPVGFVLMMSVSAAASRFKKYL